MSNELRTAEERLTVGALRKDAEHKGGGQLLARLNYACDELERLVNLIDYHNHMCQSLCGFGELEGVKCGYRPYFPRHCPTCPRDWMIER